MSDETKQIASDGGHFYLGADCERGKVGDPCYDIVGKNGKIRPFTIRDMRKYPHWKVVPSVSGILGVADKPGLRRYFDRMMWEATATTKRNDGESDDSYFERCCQWAKEHSTLAKEKGTAVHAAIERRLQGLPTDPEMLPYIESAQRALDQIGYASPTACVEHSFAHPFGYGGKIDLQDANTIIDFKTFSGIKDADKRAYPEHEMQLCSYAVGTRKPNARLYNVFISASDPSDWSVHEWPQSGRQDVWRRFVCLLWYWQLKNKFPRNEEAWNVEFAS